MPNETERLKRELQAIEREGVNGMDGTSHVFRSEAAGEKETTRWGFQPLVDARALDIIQPDIARVGGFSEKSFETLG